jgi:hypothetical protein
MRATYERSRLKERNPGRGMGGGMWCDATGKTTTTKAEKARHSRIETFNIYNI